MGGTTREKNAPNSSYKVYADFLDLVHWTPTSAIPKHVCCQRILGIAVPIHLEDPTLRKISLFRRLSIQQHIYIFIQKIHIFGKNYFQVTMPDSSIGEPLVSKLWLYFKQIIYVERLLNHFYIINFFKNIAIRD